MSPIAVGSRKEFRGIAFAGIAAGAGENFVGFAGAGIAVGSVGDFTGIASSGLIAGAFIGAGNRLSGLSAAGIGVGSRGSIHGAAASLLFVGVFNKEYNGVFEGFSISSVNFIQGLMNGLTLGIFNYADSVDGLQIDLLNYIASNPRGLQLLPFFNRQFN